MPVVSIQEAGNNLSRLVDEVGKGVDVVIARGDTPVARLVPYVAKKEPKTPGCLKGKIVIAKDFDDELPDSVVDPFYGGE